jgi:hypothetical protein
MISSKQEIFDDTVVLLFGGELVGNTVVILVVENLINRVRYNSRTV